MADSRVIRKGFIDSERVNSLSWQAECVYHRLLLVADDYGLYDGRIAYLRSQLFGMKLDQMRESDLQRALLECERAGLVRFYKAEGKPYIEIPNYNQRVQTKKPKYPPPPTVNRGELPCDTANHRLVGDVIDEQKTHVQAQDLPKLEMIIAVMKSLMMDNLQGNQLQLCAEQFLDTMIGNGWKTPSGLPVYDWKALARKWARSWSTRDAHPHKPSSEKPKTLNKNIYR